MAKEKDEKAELTSDDKLMMLLEALVAQKQQAQPFDMVALKEVLAQTSQQTAQAMQKAMKPENTEHPGISAFSYPEGDLARQKVLPPYEIWYFNYPVHMFPETEHWRELELIGQVQPGVYSILLKDQSMMQIDVKGTRDGNGKLRKLEIGIPEDKSISREEKWLMPPKTVLLYQLVHSGKGSPKRVYMEAMREYLQIALDEPESVQA